MCAGGVPSLAGGVVRTRFAVLSRVGVLSFAGSVMNGRGGAGSVRGCCEGGSMKRAMMDPPFVQQASGTHPTGMHSCLLLKVLWPIEYCRIVSLVKTYHWFDSLHQQRSQRPLLLEEQKK